MMKSKFFSCLASLFLLLGPVAAEPSLSDFDMKPGPRRLDISVHLSASPEDKAPIKVPIEGLFFSVKAPVEIVETNLLGSGISLDLNGDGDTNDSFPLKRKQGRDFLGDLEVEAFAEQSGLQNTGQGQVYKLGPKAPGILVYQTEGRLTAGLAYRGNKATFREFEGPFLQIMLLESCKAPGDPTPLKMEGSERTIWAYEAGVEGPKPTWHKVQWRHQSANAPLTFSVRGQGKGLLVLSINSSPSPGLRSRKTVVVQPIEIGE